MLVFVFFALSSCIYLCSFLCEGVYMCHIFVSDYVSICCIVLYVTECYV